MSTTTPCSSTIGTADRRCSANVVRIAINGVSGSAVKMLLKVPMPSSKMECCHGDGHGEASAGAGGEPEAAQSRAPLRTGANHVDMLEYCAANLSYR